MDMAREVAKETIAETGVRVQDAGKAVKTGLKQTLSDMSQTEYQSAHGDKFEKFAYNYLGGWQRSAVGAGVSGVAHTAKEAVKSLLPGTVQFAKDVSGRMDEKSSLKKTISENTVGTGNTSTGSDSPTINPYVFANGGSGR